MQTFSNLRRDSSNKEILKTLLFLVATIFYISLSDIYYYLPPLFGIAFILYIKFTEEKRYLYLLPLGIFLLFFEANKGYLFLSSVLFFIFSYYVVVPKIENYLNIKKYIIPIYVIYSYIFFHIFIFLLHLIFRLEPPNFHIIILYYIAIEILILSVLL